MKDFLTGLCKFWVKIEVKDYGFTESRMIYITNNMNWVLYYGFSDWASVEMKDFLTRLCKFWVKFELGF